MFLLMCKSRGRCLVISSSYHICISFIFNTLPYNTTYPSCFATSYGCLFVMVSMWSCHWRFRYLFALVSLRGWTYSNPWYISKYYRSYYFEKWSTCLKGGLLLFPSSHPMSSGYPYHQRQLSDLDGCCHCWLDLHKYGVVNIDEDNTCSDDGYLGKDMIIHWANTKRWLHSPCYWNVWVFSFSFWFTFDCLCIDHCGVSLVIFFSPFDVCFLLLIMHVHNLLTCTSHSDSLTSCYTWLNFFIFSIRHS